MESDTVTFSGIFLTLFSFYFKATWCENFGTCTPFQLKQEHLDKQLIGHGFLEVNVSHHHDCVRYCWYLAACKSLDYYRPTETCKLNDVDSSNVLETELETRALAVYSDITEWPDEIAGSCSSRPCSPKQLCLPTNPHYCMDIKCGVFPPIINGHIELVEPDRNLLLDIAMVTCEEGYFTDLPNATCQVSEIRGKAICAMQDVTTFRCHINGMWTTSACQRIDCGDPTTENGVATLLVADDSKYKALATVTCNLGYESAKSTIQCQGSRTWEPGDCNKISCGAVPSIAYGGVSLTHGGKKFYQDTADVTCDYGFTPTPNIIKCLASKSWEPAHCACEPVSGYTGTLSTTELGKTCQWWNSQSPHTHGYNSGYPDGDISAAQNYCRALGETYLWCYTTDPAERWQKCTKPVFVC